MPFDDTQAKTATAPKYKAEIAILDRLEALLSDPANWCRGHYEETHKTSARRRWFHLFPEVEFHTSFCLIGGLAHLTHQEPGNVNEGAGPRAVKNVRKRLTRLAGEHIPDYNDSHEHADILNLIGQARVSFMEETHAS